MTNLVVTTLLTARQDPQRGTHWPADPAVLSAWANSISGARAVVLADELETAPVGAELVRVERRDESPYAARWFHALSYLLTQTDEYVWVTDGSDVTMLREPWNDMRQETLYTGSEPTTVDFWWMHAAHKDPGALRWISQNRDLPLLNAGLSGGDLNTMLDFLATVCRTVTEHPDESDMAAFNMAARTKSITTGPQVHTEFKSFSDNGVAWWMHK